MFDQKDLSTYSLVVYTSAYWWSFLYTSKNQLGMGLAKTQHTFLRMIPSLIMATIYVLAFWIRHIVNST
jgi:ABC-type phosphate/phosphonate transport system permease subunit